MQVTYLTEENLIDYLAVIFPNVEWIHNKTFPGYKFRPDYRNDGLKIVVEFDGYQHYTQVKNIIKDQEKDIIYTETGYKIIRIPYFVQIETRTIAGLFDKTIERELSYPHGFIANNSTLVLPADFCELGVDRFISDLEKFHYIKDDIVKSLKDKVDLLGDKRLVVPKRLEYLIN